MPVGPRPPEVTVAGFEGPLDLLLELVEDNKLDIFTVRLGDLADEYLARVRALEALPADEVSAFLYIASRLVLLKARSLLPSLVPASEEDETDTEEELRLRLIEYATTKDRAEALGDRLRTGERTFHREGGTVLELTASRTAVSQGLHVDVHNDLLAVSGAQGLGPVLHGFPGNDFLEVRVDPVLDLVLEERGVSFLIFDLPFDIVAVETDAAISLERSDHRIVGAVQ